MNIFQYLDYRVVLTKLIEQRKLKQEKFSASNLAEVIGVQKSYLSKILNKGAHPSADQVYLISRFFNLSEDEYDYFFLLVEYERTGLAKRKKEIYQKITLIQSAHLNPRKILTAETADPKENDPFVEYYLNPFASLIHVLLSTHEYKGKHHRIGEALGVPQTYLDATIQLLEKLQIVKWDAMSKSYVVSKKQLNLSRDSFLTTPYLALFRMISSSHMMKLEPKRRIAFSATFSADETAKVHIHERFLRFIQDVETLVKEHKPEQVYQLNFDLFPWKLGDKE